MSIKILGGVARNFNLVTPNTSTTRPTSVLLKRRLFDSVQNFENKLFIDLCAGCGSVGLEALSRGAEEVFLIERSKLAYQSLKNNVQKLKLKFPELGEVDYQMEDFKKWMKKTNVLSRADEDQEVYIFFDPPYENTQLYHDFFKIINEIKFKGRVIIEACQQKTMSIEAFEENFGKIDKIFKQGTSYFAIYDF